VIKNAWYLAAWSDEVATATLARRIAGEPMTSVPASANVRTYPLVEHDGGIRVFPGDAELAAVAPVPHHPWITAWPRPAIRAKASTRRSSMA
jgi:hypothetical protein